MRVSADVLKSVAFIGRTVAGKPLYEGTCFFVILPIGSLPGQSFVYLVTAKHLAEKVAGDFWVQINQKSDGRAHQIGVENDWVVHPSDPSADVAVLPWEFSEDMDLLLISPDIMLLGGEGFAAAGVGIGDEVFLAGVFAGAQRGARNTPMVRKGHLAMLPEDKILTNDMGEVDAYLIEAHSFGGISGAPVFVRETLSLQGSRIVKKPATGRGM